MGSEDFESIKESRQALNNESQAGTITYTERFMIISMVVLILAILMIVLKQMLLAGCCIIVSMSLAIIIYRNIALLNRRSIEKVSSLLKTDTRKDRIITDFSHKIREPLNNLVITGEMFSETDPGPKQKELLDTFLASTKIMVSTVNELTMLSAAHMSHESRKHIRFNILSTVEHVIELYKLKDISDILFDISISEGSYTECIGDPVIIKQILLDIISRIEREPRNEAVKVSIKIDASIINLLLIKIHANVKTALISETAGEDCHAERLIAMSKGKFTQESVNDTSQIAIALTIKQVIPDSGQKAPATRIEELILKKKIRKELKDLKVLLVEDNVINQKITLLTLKPLVFSIDTATNGKEALEMFGTNNYDLILMDIQMPVMNGLTATEKIRALESTTNSHVPIIAITANAMIGDKEKCLSSGADDYISKPFQPLLLVEKIKQVI